MSTPTPSPSLLLTLAYDAARASVDATVAYYSSASVDEPRLAALTHARAVGDALATVAHLSDLELAAQRLRALARTYAGMGADALSKANTEAAERIDRARAEAATPVPWTAEEQAQIGEAS